MNLHRVFVSGSNGSQRHATPTTPRVRRAAAAGGIVVALVTSSAACSSDSKGTAAATGIEGSSSAVQPAISPSGVASAGPSASFSGAPIPIRIGITVATSNLPIPLGVKQGFDAQQGIDATYVTIGAGANLIQDMAAGSIDATVPGLLPSITAWSAGVPLEALNMLEVGGAKLRLWATKSSGISSFKGLKGHRVAIQEGTDSAAGFEVALKDNGLSTSDVHLVNMTWANMPAALASNQVDAALTSEPTGTVIAQTMQATVESLGDMSQYYNDGVVFAVSDSWLKAHPDGAKRLMIANLESLKWMRDNPQEAATLGAQFVGKTTTVESIAAQLKILTFDGAVDSSVLEDTKAISDYLLEQHTIKADPDSAKHMQAYVSLYQQVIAADPSLASSASS